MAENCKDEPLSYSRKSRINHIIVDVEDEEGSHQRRKYSSLSLVEAILSDTNTDGDFNIKIPKELNGRVLRVVYESKQDNEENFPKNYSAVHSIDHWLFAYSGKPKTIESKTTLSFGEKDESYWRTK